MRRIFCVRGILPKGGLVAMVALALSGCVSDGVGGVQNLAAPKSFDGAASRKIGGVESWASAFGSGELSRLLEQARKDNLDVAAAAARIQQANAQAAIFAAPLFPAIGATTSAASTQVPGTASRTSPPFNASRQASFAPGLTASYQIDFWGRNRDGATASERLAGASRFDRSVVEIASVSSVATAYFTMLAAQDRLKIVRENVATASLVLAAIKSRVAAGTASNGFETAQQESVLATLHASAPPLETTVAQSRIAIAVLLGLPPERFAVKGGSLSALRIPRLSPGLPSEVLARRPDVAEAEARLEAQGYSVEGARKAMLPSIALTGQGSFESAVVRNLFSPHAIAYSVAAGIAEPLFDGGALKGNLNLQKAVYVELAMGARKTTLAALADVENALVASRLTARQVALDQASVAAAQRVFDASVERMRQGTIDVVSLSTTETALFQARDALAQARLGRFLSSVALYQALGGGWSR